jgi:endonuclease/exonuclease/phosphatase family metal-dependent hydrolase
VSRLRIATWNCFGAAQSARAFLLREGAPERQRFQHQDVAAFLAAADVVCMQELWVDDARALFSRLPFPHKAQDDNRTELWPLTIGGAGLGVASRAPIVAQRLVPYSRPHSGAERFARKGALHTRLALVGGAIDVVTTHLQAGSSPAAVAVRARQVAELRALIAAEGDAARPMLVCGDFNIDGRGGGAAEYAALTGALHGFEDLGAATDLPTYHPHPEHNPLAHRFDRRGQAQRIDYLFFRSPARGPRVRAFARALDTALSSGVHPSDHFALVAELDLDG